MTARLAGTLIVALVIFSMGWTVASWKHGRTIERMKKETAEVVAAAHKHARKVEADNRIKGDAAVSVDIQGRKETAAKKEEAIREVIKYVKTPAAKCQLDADWVRIHNKFSGGSVSDTP